MSTTISPEAPETVKESKPKQTRSHKPLYDVAEGTKLEATPEDFNPDTHRITKAMFANVPAYMDHQAWIHDFRAKALREKAEDYRVNGPPKKGGARQKLLGRLAKLEAKLAELGVNVDDLFGDDDSEE